MMESPAKRLKHSPLAPTTTDDFISLSTPTTEQETKYGYTNDISHPPSPPRNSRPHHDRRDPRFDRRNAQDRPKSKHPLPNHKPWILVKTKLGGHFVHNTQTKQSLWRVPEDVLPGVLEFETEGEREENARWAEEQLRGMKAEKEREREREKVLKGGEDGARARRRRSESLQREDEEALMAELKLQADAQQMAEEEGQEKEEAEEVRTLEPKVGDVGYDSEGSYEYVEVTDDEGEDGVAREADPAGRTAHPNGTTEAQPEPDNEPPVEFGEDDIAFQLAAMGESYGLDADDYSAHPHHDQDYASDQECEYEDQDDPTLSTEEATTLFRTLLSDHSISPFTPWDKLISDETSETSILNDDRYTVLPTTKARKEVWEQWCRDEVARLKLQRQQEEKQDPRIAYLEFLAEHASPKLYWAEFKRKFKRDSFMTDRKLEDKVREKLYREFVGRMKLPEKTRRADFVGLLKGLSIEELESVWGVEGLPQRVKADVRFVGLERRVREEVVREVLRENATQAAKTAA